MQSMKVSVIIPIYNTGEYLRPCIESITNQTHRDLQIIMIDDGSKPDTAELCDRIASTDERITVIHKPNEGVSIARNVGLSQASGEIVCFVDSDDTIAPNMIKALVDALVNSDAQIAMCDAVTISPGRADEPDTIPDYDSSCVINTKGLAPATLTRLAGSACRCAYRRIDTLVTSGAKFPEGVKFSEDRIFNIIAMGAASRIAYLKQPLYNRLIREGSACFRYYPDMVQQIVKMRKVLIKAVRNSWGNDYVQAYEQQIAGHILYSITNFTASKANEPAHQRLIKLRKLCADNSIRDCLEKANCSGLRGKLILGKHYFLLFAIGWSTNIYHKLCRKGQYQA